MEHRVIEDNATDGRAADLERAFRAFNAHSTQLELAYRALQARFEAMQVELASARSERLRHLAEKERLADRLAGLLATLPGAVVVLDGEAVVRDANAAAELLLGQGLVGRRWEELAAERLTDAGHAGAGDAELRTREHRYVELRRRALFTEPGEILLLTDVTETRELRERLARQERLSAMGEVAARLAHQIRTPLTGAMLYASRFAERPSPELGARILLRLRRVESMVRDMLAFSRGESLHAETFAVARLLDEVACGVDLPHCGLQVRDGTAGCRLRGDRDGLRGALLNLIHNAAEAAGGNVSVTVEARATRAGTLQLIVADDGPGLDEALRERIFEPFFTTRPGGTGLGLAVVRSVARAHGGDVTCASPACGGARFTLELPSADAGAPEKGSRAVIEHKEIEA